MTAAVLLAFARAAGFVARAPGFSRSGVPSTVRIAFALFFALAIAPSLAPLHHLDLLSFALAAGGEAIAGAALGIAGTLVAEAVAAAGRVLDDCVGLRAGISLAVAPPGLGGLWTLVFVAALFGLGGIERLLDAFARSFTLIPIGAPLDPRLLAIAGPAFADRFMRLAFELATPALSIVAVVHLAFAALGRIVPRLANLMLGFPAAYAAVLLAAFASMVALRDLAAAPLDPTLGLR